ncbi:MAG: S-layer homology domain-containing protein [Armatimonadota bacterium]
MQARVVLVICVLLVTVSRVTLAQKQVFKDVPETHWAAEAVQYLAKNKVIQGYPDGNFRGDQPVTRYELAVLLLRFTEFITETLQVPLESAGSSTSSDRVESKPASKKGLSVVTKDEPAIILIRRGFLPEDSILLKYPGGQVGTTEVADTFAWVLKRIVELNVSAAGDRLESECQEQQSNAKNWH